MAKLYYHAQMTIMYQDQPPRISFLIPLMKLYDKSSSTIQSPPYWDTKTGRRNGRQGVINPFLIQFTYQAGKFLECATDDDYNNEVSQSVKVQMVLTV